MYESISEILENEKKLEERLNRIIEKNTENRKSLRDSEYINNQACYEGLQWKLASYNQEESPFVIQSDINHLKNAIDNRLGSLYASDYTGELLPKSERDVESIKSLNILVKNEWKCLRIDQKIRVAIKSGAIMGDGYIEFIFNPDVIVGSKDNRYEGILEVNIVDTASVYIDASATSFENSDNIVIKKVQTIEWLRREHEDWYNKLIDKKGKEFYGQSSELSKSGEIFTGRDYNKNRDNVITINAVYLKYPEKISIIKKEETDEDTGEVIVSYEDFLEGQVPEGVEIYKNIIRTRIKIFYVIDGILVGRNESYPLDEYNIVPFRWDDVPQLAYGVPLVRGLTTPQKVCNLIESAANNIALNWAIPTRVVSQESGLNIDELAVTKGAVGVIYMVNGDPTRAIHDLTPPPMDRSMTEWKGMFVNEIKEYAGITAPYLGSIGTSGATAQGSNEAINRATVIDNNPISQIENFVEKITRLLIKHMAFYYAGRKIFVRVPGEKKGDYTFDEYLVEHDISNIDYDFIIDLAIKTANDKNRQYNLLKELFTIANQYKSRESGLIKLSDLAEAAQLDIYNALRTRYVNATEEEMTRKTELIIRLLEMAKTITPNGEPLIAPEEIQEAMMDVLDDNNDTSYIEEIIARYEEYQNKLQETTANLENEQMGIEGQMTMNPEQVNIPPN